VTREDLPTVTDPILAYMQWRQACGLPISDWWADKVRTALERQGLVKPRPGLRTPAHDGTVPAADPPPPEGT